MRLTASESRSSFAGAALFLLYFPAAVLAQSQSTPAAPAPAPEPPKRVGGFVPGQHREPGDPAQIARGNTIYGINCAICHGGDLRGGDMGGPNLLRSQVALSDRQGELILPIIQGSRQNSGMPAIQIPPADGLAAAAYIRSVLETIGTQGKPPSVGQAPPNVVVGNAKEGEAYFAAKCGGCHSAKGDLQGIATKITDPKDLQTAWVRGQARRGRTEEASPDAADPRAVTVSVTGPSGERVEGRLIHVDDFLVSVRPADGGVRTFRRTGDSPKVEIHDPMKMHRDLLTQYTDRDIHDVTAFLTTLK